MRQIISALIILSSLLVLGCIQPSICEFGVCDSNKPILDENNLSCVESIDREMNVFKLALENNSVNGIDSNKFTLNLEKNCSLSESKLKIEFFNEELSPSVCSSICGEDKNYCSILTFSSLGLPDKKICLNLPKFILFEDVDWCDCWDLPNYSDSKDIFWCDNGLIEEGYEVIDLRNVEYIQSGSFVIKNATPKGHPFPISCVWYKK